MVLGVPVALSPSAMSFASSVPRLPISHRMATSVPPSSTFANLRPGHGLPHRTFARSGDLAHLVRVWPLRGDAERVVFLNSRGFKIEHHFLVQTGFWCKADIS